MNMGILLLELVLVCAVFTILVKLGVGNNALNGLFFYPKPVQEKVYALGLTTREKVGARRKVFMPLFFLGMGVTFVFLIGFVNRCHTFWEAYFQALFFLEGMNWFDGIVIDRLWVGHSRFWVIPGTEDVPFVQTWGQVLKKRGILTLIWILGAALVAGLVVLLT